MLHNTFWILKQRPGRSLAVVVSTQVVQSIQQPHYQFVQRGGQKQYSMYFSQVVGWQVVSREAAPFPETSWHSSWRARGQPGQQIQTNQLRNTNVQINANESIQNVDVIFLPSVLWRLLWANRFLGKYRTFHTQNVRGVWLDPSSTCLKWPGCLWFNRDDGMLNHTVCVQYGSHHIAIPRELCAQRNLHFLKNQVYIFLFCAK